MPYRAPAVAAPARSLVIRTHGSWLATASLAAFLFLLFGGIFLFLGTSAGVPGFLAAGIASFGAAFVALFLGLARRRAFRTLRVDATTVLLEEFRFLSSRARRVRSLPIERVVGVKVELHEGTDSDGDPCTLYGISLTLTSGDPVPLRQGLTSDAGEALALARTVEDLLKTPET